MKEELRIRAAKLFTPITGFDKWEHDFTGLGDCRKCGQGFQVSQHDEYCTVPTPIVIDWNVAMKLRYEVNKDDFFAALTIIVRNRKQLNLSIVDCQYYAIAEDYILAACIAKEAENG